MKNNIRVAIYARKSSESEDRQVLSIDSQVKEMHDLAAQHGLSVDRVYIEAKSAKSPGRPVFNEMFKLIERGQLGTVICWKLDRLARNPLDGGALIWALDQGQLAQIITPSAMYTNSGNDKFWIQLEFGMAKKYVDDLSDNVKRGIRAKLELGWLPRTAPIGYLNEKVNKTIIKDPDRFDLVRRLWDEMLSGTSSISQVHRLATKQLKLMTPLRDGSERGPMAFSGLVKLLQNPFYYGVLRVNGEIFKGAHPPMISKSEFDKVQNILHGRNPVRPQRHDHLYIGLIKCGECAASVTAEQKTNRYGTRYTYYRCTRHKAGVDCSQRAISEEYLERQLMNFMDSVSLPLQYREWISQALADLNKQSEHASVARLGSLKRTLELKTKELTELLTLRLRGLITDDQYRERQALLQSEKIDLERRIFEFEESAQTASEATRKVFNTAINARTTFAKSNPEDRRKLIKTLCSDLFLKDKILNIQAQKPFELIQKSLCLSESENGTFGPQMVGEHQRSIGSANGDFSKWWVREESNL
ncbi:MAG: recombinase family protein [Candidatus Kerfeldbacteria bacterium]|nr:recombinase family protein [Candidatus Kerfeldbacteria bacterium]